MGRGVPEEIEGGPPILYKTFKGGSPVLYTKFEGGPSILHTNFQLEILLNLFLQNTYRHSIVCEKISARYARIYLTALILSQNRYNPWNFIFL